jgi:hypothetical protein
MGEAGAAFAVTSLRQTSLILAYGYASKYIDISLRYEHTDSTVNNNGTAGKVLGQVVYV